jgi:hypothetical protein
MHATFTLKLKLTFACLLGLGGCGGGSDDANTPPPTGGPACDAQNGCGPLLTQDYIRRTHARPLYGVSTLDAYLSATSQAGYAYRADLLVDGATAVSTEQCTFSRVRSFCTLSLDTSTLNDGVHTFTIRVSDGVSRSAETKTAAVMVQNKITVPLQLSTEGIAPPPASHPTGTGEFTANLITGEVSASLALSGIDTVDSVRLCRGQTVMLGQSCNALLSFVRSPIDPNRWSLPLGATVEPNHLSFALFVGNYYVEAKSSSRIYPEGVVQAAVLAGSVQRFFAPMTGEQVSPPLSTSLKGIAAVTIGPESTNIEALAYDSSGPVSGTAASFNYGPFRARVPGNGPYWSTTEASNGLVVGSLRSGTASFVIKTEAQPNGEIAAQLHFSPGAKLSELQASIFTPKCSGCHDGSGTTLPGSLDLRAGMSYAALTNVDSVQQPTLKRVDPSWPAESYLLHKVEGVVTITGAHMPLSGPPLTREEIDAISSWIRYQALND